MVTAPASTGSDSNIKPPVMRIDHTNNGILCMRMPGARMLRIVVMRLIDPITEDAPDMWIAKMVMSTAGPG